MKMGKTESKLMAKLEVRDRVGYDGIRESGASRKLEAKGLVKRTPCDGTYYHRRWDGSYSRRYHPQGYIEKV